MKKDRLRIAVPFDFRPDIGFFLRPDYVRSLHAQGAEILPLLYDTDQMESTLEKADGLLIPGGLGDLNPELYGQPKKYDNVKIVQERCDFEYKLLEKMLPTQKPILAICWGFQMLNVFMGGSLYQDLGEDFETELRHEQSEPGHVVTHSINFKAEGLAKDLCQNAILQVNSTHHQGVDRLGKDLIEEGRAEDGLLECFRVENHPWAWGVQWHPERIKGEPFIPAFLSAARKNR